MSTISNCFVFVLLLSIAAAQERGFSLRGVHSAEVAGAAGIGAVVLTEVAPIIALQDSAGEAPVHLETPQPDTAAATGDAIEATVGVSGQPEEAPAAEGADSLPVAAGEPRGLLINPFLDSPGFQLAESGAGKGGAKGPKKFKFKPFAYSKTFDGGVLVKRQGGCVLGGCKKGTFMKQFLYKLP